MAKNDFGKGLKEKLQIAAETAKILAKDATKDVKLPSAEEIKAGAKGKLAEVKESFKKKEKSTPKEQSEVLEFKVLSTRCALKIIYYLMAADGEVFHSEEEKFDAIGKELDPAFSENKESIVAECRAQMSKVLDPDDYFDVLQDGVEDALLASKPSDDSFVTPKLLVWDLLTVAYSDEQYDEAERKLLKYIVRKTNIDKAIFLEMESSILTLMDIEKELTWIKTTNKPYLTIEAMVNELMDRKNVIFESVKDLISL
jgi:uncharacterized tellurite resistance protein B-like protein